MSYYVYLLASKRNGTVYVGMTSDLVRRVWEHKNDLVEGFTKRYQVHTLVWFEVAEEPSVAILRGKQIKKWNRRRKLDLIEGKSAVAGSVRIDHLMTGFPRSRG